MWVYNICDYPTGLIGPIQSYLSFLYALSAAIKILYNLPSCIQWGVALWRELNSTNELTYLFFFPPSIKEMSPHSTLQSSTIKVCIWKRAEGCWQDAEIERHQLFWKPSCKSSQWRKEMTNGPVTQSQGISLWVTRNRGCCNSRTDAHVSVYVCACLMVFWREGLWKMCAHISN